MAPEVVGDRSDANEPPNLDGAPLACPDPRLVTLGLLPYGTHTFHLDVANAAGTAAWETTWTGGQAPPA